MKHLLLLPPLVLATASGTLFGACNLDESSQVQSLDEETRVVTLDIAGMTWAAGWTPQVRKALESLPWARSAVVDYPNKQATVTVVSKSYEEKTLLAALKDAGFGGSIAAEPEESGDEESAAKAPDGAQVAFHVTGMMKTKSGATWVGWPNKVTEALEGTHSTLDVTWDYGADVVTITYDPDKTEPAKLAKVIEALDYAVEQVPVEDKDEVALSPAPAPLPDDAPEEFASAFRAARAACRPMLIDFGATWCVPCVKLKKKTLAAPTVAEALDGVDVIHVDLDEHPKLAEAYGVGSVPDLFFVDVKGSIIGRLQEFEEPGPFLERLKDWRSLEDGLRMATIGIETAVPSDEVAEALGLTNNVRLHGRQISGLELGGPAADAGLQRGDVLLSLGGNDLYSHDDIADFLSVSSPGDDVPVVFRREGDAAIRRATLNLGGRPVAAKAQPALGWQFSGPSQLAEALEVARAQKKKVLVGLSGAETWWPSTRFESRELSTILNDPAVVQAAGDYVRVIVRRPHAYWFIDELFKDRGGIQLGTPAGCTLADGTTAPLPGVYLLDADGGHIDSVGLVGPDALENLRKLLGGSWEALATGVVQGEVHSGPRRFGIAVLTIREASGRLPYRNWLTAKSVVPLGRAHP